MALTTRDSSARRAQRNRTRLRKLANGRPRLSVFRSSKNIYAQIIDDERGVTLAAASSLESDQKTQKGADKDAAARVGALVAQRAIEKGVKDVVFDRGGYLYHGRVKALADAALIIDDLGVDVLRRTEDRQPRAAVGQLAQPGPRALRAAQG